MGKGQSSGLRRQMYNAYSQVGVRVSKILILLINYLYFLITGQGFFTKGSAKKQQIMQR